MGAAEGLGAGERHDQIRVLKNLLAAVRWMEMKTGLESKFFWTPLPEQRGWMPSSLTSRSASPIHS